MEMARREDVTNILLCGVGGQGIGLAGNILARVYLKAGHDIKISEIHGMAQRGGDVTAHVRYGKRVYSPVIEEGDVDFLLAFEQLEGLRYINHCRDDATIMISNERIPPLSVGQGLMAYPDDIEGTFRRHFPGKVHMVRSRDMALRIGDLRAANIVLVGAFSRLFPEIDRDVWLEALQEVVPARVLSLNRTAFEEGRTNSFLTL